MYCIDTLFSFQFSITKLSSSPICVNSKLLSHINQQHIQFQLQSNPDLLIAESIQFIHDYTNLSLPSDMNWKSFYDYTNVTLLANCITLQTRIHTLQDTATFLQQLYNTPSIDYTSIPSFQYVKDHQLLPFFKKVNEDLSNLSSFNHDTINDALVYIIVDANVQMNNLNSFVDHRKKLMATLRICVTGSKNGFV